MLDSHEDTVAGFRFHTGSIKRLWLCACCAGGSGFDSILVRLKGNREAAVNYAESRFDSILVRLKANWTKPTKILSPKFRFHTGSIKRNVNKFIQELDFEFRFHTGSIKSRNLAILQKALLRCFDSILVRLKAFLYYRYATTTLLFRFHTGSIKRSCVSPQMPP